MMCGKLCKKFVILTLISYYDYDSDNTDIFLNKLFIFI